MAIFRSVGCAVFDMSEGEGLGAAAQICKRFAEKHVAPLIYWANPRFYCVAASAYLERRAYLWPAPCLLGVYSGVALIL